MLVVRIEKNPSASLCPSCGKPGRLQWQWKPDLEPTRERLRCHGCGWSTGWIAYGGLRVSARGEKVKAPPARARAGFTPHPEQLTL